MTFPHELLGRRDSSDPELVEHLRGFIGYVLAKSSQEMTTTKYHLLKHIERVRTHISVNVEDSALDAFAGWAWAANAILFLPNGTICDPSGNTLFFPSGKAPDEAARIPFPDDAIHRKQRNDAKLAKLRIRVPETLPPVIGEFEADMRDASEVALRAFALITVAIRAESLATGNPMPVARLKEICPVAFTGLSPAESDFLANDHPPEQDIINFAWRYEALLVLQWALGWVDDLPFPSSICDVPATSRTMVERNEGGRLPPVTLRPAAELLEALDFHYRLHWAVRQAGLDEREAPGGLDPGVVMERHHALNWLTQFDPSDWDDVDTPT